MLELQNIIYSIRSTQILHDISLRFRAGELSVIIGPNGSGKSTLLKIASAELQPSGGTVKYDDRIYHGADLAKLARIRAMLTQQSQLNFPLTVEEIVKMGRYPHFGNVPSKNDLKVIEEVIDELQLADIRYRNYLTLSGGEKQRVHYGRVMAQIWRRNGALPRYLLLDEPVSYLDINYQQELLKRSAAMAKHGDVVVAVLHDLNLACQYADRIFVLDHGKLIAEGAPEAVITADLIYELYKVNALITKSKGQNLVINVPDGH